MNYKVIGRAKISKKERARLEKQRKEENINTHQNAAPSLGLKSLTLHCQPFAEGSTSATGACTTAHAVESLKLSATIFCLSMSLTDDAAAKAIPGKNKIISFSPHVTVSHQGLIGMGTLEM